MIALIDYGAGNLSSVQHALDYIGCAHQITKDPAVLQQADAAILPGVGSFGHAMTCMQQAGMVQPVLDFIGSGKPFLGICLGLQLLFESSEESPGVAGLGVLAGNIVRIPNNVEHKVPHIGWNSLQLHRKSGLFAGMEAGPYVYFVHSYYLKAQDRSIVAATSDYGVLMDVAVRKENLYAVQFHPEKSGQVGIAMLKQFAALIQQ